jgi:hypothetical protein
LWTKLWKLVYWMGEMQAIFLRKLYGFEGIIFWYMWNICAILCYGLLINILNSYQSDVEFYSTGIPVVPSPMSSSYQHRIVQSLCLSFLMADFALRR